MNDTTTPKRRGRPPSARPARTSAQKMREARERVQAALNAPGGDVGTLPDSLLLEALAVAFRKRMVYDFWFAVQALTERLNKNLPADQCLYLTREWGADRGTVTGITETIPDTVTETDSDTVTIIDSDTVTDNNEPFALAPAASPEPLSARDAEILSRFAAGESKRGIARQMGCSDSTVRNVLARQSHPAQERE